jgi:hypothetical protein
MRAFCRKSGAFVFCLPQMRIGRGAGPRDCRGTCEDEPVSEAPVTGPQPPPPDPGQRPARYPRTANGLIGSLLVTLLFVGAYVAFRALTREELEVKPEPVDYVATVANLQRSDVEVVYPKDLPEGWIASSLDVVPGDDPAFGVGMLTDDGEFVGVRQEDAPLDNLLTRYVDDEPTEGEVLTVTGSVARTWRSFTDSGGDLAYAAELGDDEVLVYGSASAADLRELIGLLTTDPR